MKRPFAPVTAVFFAYGSGFDATAFCLRHGGNWKARQSSDCKSAYVYRFEPELMKLTNDEQLEVAMEFLETHRQQLLELRDLTEVRRMCIQTNHAFSGYESASAASFSVEFMKRLCELDIELGAYVAVQCDSSIVGM